MSNFVPITEETHPIEIKWVTMPFFLCALVALFSMGFNVKESPPFIIFIVGVFVSLYAWLTRENFHYEFGEKEIHLKQGVIRKSERIVIYGRIQNVRLSQNFIDRFLGLASIVIETASEGAGAKIYKKAPKKEDFWPGFNSNRIAISGLLYENAADIRDVVIQLIKMNPIDDAQSGL